MKLQMRFDVVVKGTDSYCDELQTVASVHCRSDVDVAALLSYCVPRQAVRSRQTRFDVGVDAIDSNCVELQTVSGMHCRSVVKVAALLSYCTDG